MINRVSSLVWRISIWCWWLQLTSTQPPEYCFHQDDYHWHPLQVRLHLHSLLALPCPHPPRWSLNQTSSPPYPTRKQTCPLSPIEKSQTNIITDSPKTSHNRKSSLPHSIFTNKHDHRLPQNKSLSNIVAISPMMKSQSKLEMVGRLIGLPSWRGITIKHHKIDRQQKNTHDHWRLTKENLCLSSPDSSGSTVHPMWGILLSKRNHCQAGFHNVYAVCTLHYA